MTQIAFIDLAFLLDNAGFPDGESQANGLAVIACESGRDPAAKNTNNPDGSTDRGLWQINSAAHPEVTDDCAYDSTGVCSTGAAFKISNSGTDFGPWVCYSKGEYEAHMEAARVALDAKARLQAKDAAIAALDAQITSLNAQLAQDSDQIANLTSQLSAANTQITALQTKIDNAKNALA